MKRANNKGFTLIELLVVITIIALIASLAFPAYNIVSNMGNQAKAANNCRQVITMLRIFADENNSLYPDSVKNPVTGSQPLTSNDAFRTLFQAIPDMKEEKVFGCPASKYNPDGNIGLAPTYDKALEPGENHWAMTQGLSSAGTGSMPLVFENPVSPSWPPQWNADAAGKPLPGRAWAGGKVIVGKNDGSVDKVKLQTARGPSVPPEMLGNGVDMFTQASDNIPQQILNIAAGGTTSYTNYQTDPSMGGGLPPPPGGGLPPPPAQGGYPGAGLPPPPATGAPAGGLPPPPAQ